MSNVVQSIKAERIIKGLTPYALAKASGVSLSHVYAIENGEKIPSVDVAAALCKALDCSLEVRSNV
ncbi:helix-turn-helix transcriptional regulator [Synergistes jonesii]|uniref:helix-turn-helix transcriptional regulator n=1 Tax=Synergistes jonesii TaxID=2754 RepID=UPI00248E60BE|nr:helix-turn-helix transcriptional regulator [Synergistes jonesii]